MPFGRLYNRKTGTATFGFTFEDGNVFDRFSLEMNAKADWSCEIDFFNGESFTCIFSYPALMDKLAELGHSAVRKRLVVIDKDGTRYVVRDSATLWDAIRHANYSDSYIPLGYCINNDFVYFRFKDGNLCHRFSLELDRRENAYEVLLDKLKQLGCAAKDKTLVCVENDGALTRMEDCDSLWSLIEISRAGGPDVTLQLEYVNH